MAIIKCKMCGGDIVLNEDKTLGTCEYCGSQMTLPKASDEQRAARFNRGNHFRRQGEFDKALAVYESIVREDDADAEAHWCCALCRFGIEYVEDPNTFEYLPTCHRASFDSFLEDVDYLAALEHSDGITRRQYQRDAAKIAEVQKGILATSRNEEPFDVFLCYKETDDQTKERTRDSLDAQEIYYQLTQAGYRVFFSRITLEDKAGTEYEPYIFAALNSAKVMVAVGSKPEYFNAVWVKNEWSRFLALMRMDRSKLLLPCYKNMDPYDLPEQLSVLQSYDMGKIGFMQDLIRGIKKVLAKDEPKAQPAPQQVIVRETAGGGANVTALLDRGAMALEDREWEKASGYYDQVLNLDARNGAAYLGLALVKAQCPSLDAYLSKLSRQYANEPEQVLEACEPETARINAAVERLAVPGYLEAETIREAFAFDLTYPSREAAAEENKKRALSWFHDRSCIRAKQYADPALKARLDAAEREIAAAGGSRIEAARRDAEAARQNVIRAYQAHLAAQEQRIEAESLQAQEQREETYQNACRLQKKAVNGKHLQVAGEYFQKLQDYKDSNERAVVCAKKARRKTIAARSAAGIVILAVLAAVIYLLIAHIIPGSRYRSAEALLAAGKYEEAAAAYQALGDYKDSPNKALEASYRAAEKLLKDGRYEEAAAAYQALGDYKDSTYKALEASYRAAEKLLEDGRYEEAAVAFEALDNFKGSVEKAKEASYRAAESLAEGGNLYASASAFYRLSGYRDAWDRCFALWGEITQRETLSAGWDHTVGVKSDGTVVAVGENEDGQCEVSDWTDIAAASAGFHYTVGLKTDGTAVWTEDRPSAADWKDLVAISANNYTIGLKADGTVVTTAYEDVSGWKDIKAVSAGAFFLVGLKTDGTVVAVGDNDFGNEFGQCGVSDWRDVVAIAAGDDHTVGLKADGTVVAVGKNEDGQCEVSDWTDVVAIAAGFYHTVGLKRDGTVVVAGHFSEIDVSEWTNITAITAGYGHIAGLKADGTVVATGWNNDGQCDVDGWRGIKQPE